MIRQKPIGRLCLSGRWLVSVLACIVLGAVFLSGCSTVVEEQSSLSSADGLPVGNVFSSLASASDISSSAGSSSVPAVNSSSGGAEVLAPSSTYVYCYDLLTDDQKNFYQMLEQGQITEDAPFKLSGIEEKDQPYIDALYLYLNNHRTLSWVNPGYYLQMEETSGKALFITAGTRFDNRGQEADMQAKLATATEEWLAALPGKEADDYTKIVAIAELLCERVTYNYVAAYGYGYSELSAQEKEVTRYTHSEYGALVNGSAICTGYAAAFQYLCDLLGVTSIYADGYAGYATGSTAHAWNMVWLDGAWYHVDVTWMDNGWGNDYSYLLVSDEQIQADHYNFSYGLHITDTMPSQMKTLPAARRSTGGYFDREGRLFTTAEDAVAYVDGHITVDEPVTIQLAGEREFYRAKQLLHDRYTEWKEDGEDMLRYFVSFEKSGPRVLSITAELVWSAG